MAKKKKFTLHSELPVEELYAVLSSERYLLTKEEMERPERANITDTSYERREEDGVVAARVRMESLLPTPETPNSKAAAKSEASDATADGAEAPKTMVIEQTTHVQPLGSDKRGTGFGFSTVMPLPGNIGAMFTDMDMSPAKKGSGTDIDVEVRVDVSIPIVGARLSKQLLGNSEETVSKGIRRAERIAQNGPQ